MEFERELSESAIALWRRVSHVPWISTIGIGREGDAPIFIVYTEKRLSEALLREIPSEWQGISVKVDFLGRVKPQGHPAG